MTMRLTPLDVALVLRAALCDECRERAEALLGPETPAAEAALCDECRSLPQRIVESLRRPSHPDALAAFAARILTERWRPQPHGSKPHGRGAALARSI